jgi:AmmeMemoRadiSam system protein B
LLRLPAVAGQFYPSNPNDLKALVLRYTRAEPAAKQQRARACLVPHAGYVYSGHVAGAVFSRIAIPKKIVILGVRHRPPGAAAAILSNGAWRTPLGDAAIDAELANALCAECPMLREDEVAHGVEHSLEVQLPFLQVLAPGFTFVPVALGGVRFEELLKIGDGIARVLAAAKEDMLLVTSSDLNHYENEAITRAKDGKAIERLLALDAWGLFDVCRNEEISMCGLGPAVAMIAAMNALGVKNSDLVKYATSGEVSGDYEAVVGYAGMIFL